MTWEKGRQLKSFDNIQYTYNANGIRTSKTVDNVRHDYVVDGAKILKETWQDNVLIPIYNNDQEVIGIYYNCEPYYFYKNLQGDVIGISDTDGRAVVSYTYDAWGVCTVLHDYTDFGLANTNPYRYRSYYYDAEIGLYYVSNRYYDPIISKWISPEPNVVYGEFDEGAKLLGYNIYAYCANNPILYKDETSESITFACVLIFAAIGLVVGAVIGAHKANKNGYDLDDGWKYWKYVVGYGVVGGVIGALVGWGAGALIAKFGVPTAAASITKGGGAKFSTFNSLKNSLGSAGKGRQWHHIVEQCQIKSSRAGFSKFWVHNSNNVINLTDDVHGLISRFYSIIPNPSVVNTGGKVFRDWLTGMSFEQQYKWGIWVLRYFGVKI